MAVIIVRVRFNPSASLLQEEKGGNETSVSLPPDRNQALRATFKN